VEQTPDAIRLVPAGAPEDAVDHGASPSDIIGAIRAVNAEFLSGHHALAAFLDLNPSDMAALTHLANIDGAITQEELRRRLRLSKGAMSALVERMVRAGFLERRPNPEDRRSQLLTVSARSAAGREWHRGQLELRLRAAAGRYDAGQRATILAFLTDVRAAVAATNERLHEGRRPPTADGG
jgi:DNA-binding MarR family transcriptional regulator